MIEAVAGAVFTADAQNFPTGLTGTIGVQILAGAGDAILVGRRTAGIIETPAGSGSYVATLTAPADPGSYRVFWDTGVIGPSTTAEEELAVVAAAGATDYTPTLAAVAALVPSRAKNQYGRIPTFDADTKPTAAQVQSIIDGEAAAMQGMIGEPADALIPLATRLLTLRAALMVELTYFGDQVQAGRSPYNELKGLYDDAKADYRAARANLGRDLEPGTADDQSPLYSFPPLSSNTDGFWSVPTPGAEQPIDPAGGPTW